MPHSSLPGIPDTSSGSSSASSTGKTKATNRAYLLSQATATAVVAAKSILFAGGSEDVALQTARAAAASVLQTDGDAASRRSLGFFGRRKVRRQAEVVASMALVTASGSMHNGVPSDWSTSDSTPLSHITPYARNITTRPMHNNDDPSVLSERPPRPPLGPSALSQGFNMKRPVVSVLSASYPTSPLTKTTSEQPTTFSLGSPRLGEVPASENVDPIAVPPPSPARSLFGSPRSLFGSPQNRVTSEKKVKEQENVGAIVALGKNTNIIDDDTTVYPASVWTAKENGGWNDLDPLLNTVSSVFSLLTCSPMAKAHGSTHSDGIPRRITHRREVDTVTTGHDTIDERTDEGTEFPSLDSYDDTQGKGQTVSSSSSGESSIGSSFTNDIHSRSATSEGDIHVRNSLHKKMEKIVSKSRKDYDSDDSRWKTYELGDRATRVERDMDLTKRAKTRATRVTPKNRKRGFFAHK